MKSIAFLVPSTSKNRDWKDLNDTYLYQHLLPSINSLTKNFSMKVFIGIDDDDELYTNMNYLPTFYPPLLSASPVESRALSTFALPCNVSGSNGKSVTVIRLVPDTETLMF